jgi:hypothetical protein
MGLIEICVKVVFKTLYRKSGKHQNLIVASGFLFLKTIQLMENLTKSQLNVKEEM